MINKIVLKHIFTFTIINKIKERELYQIFHNRYFIIIDYK